MLEKRPIVSSIAFALILAGCDRTPEPVRADNGGGSNGASPSTPGATNGGGDKSGADTQSANVSVDPSKKQGDPLDGKFTLQEALRGITGSGALIAKIDTNKGALECKLYEDKAPNTVANFVGLATGKRPWKSPEGPWVTRPAYDGTTFHRIIKGFMIQGGDARGDGSGEPGYIIKDEVWAGAKHNRAGLLCMANRGPNTNGAQFFVTDAAAPHLDVSYTIFGECAPEQTVHDIANVPTGMRDRPLTPVTIKTVTVSREKPADAPKP